MNFKKLNDYEIEITEEIIKPETIKKTYKRDFIENQIIEITKQRDEMIALKEKELKDCQDILKEMDKLNIKIHINKNEENIF